MALTSDQKIVSPLTMAAGLSLLAWSCAETAHADRKSMLATRCTRARARVIANLHVEKCLAIQMRRLIPSSAIEGESTLLIVVRLPALVKRNWLTFSTRGG